MERIGGKINEDRQSDSGEMSRLLHAVFGLYHYPSYLERWNDAEIAVLEKDLEKVLAKVRAQRAAKPKVKKPTDRMAFPEKWTVEEVFVSAEIKFTFLSSAT